MGYQLQEVWEEVKPLKTTRNKNNLPSYYDCNLSRSFLIDFILSQLLLTNLNSMRSVVKPFIWKCIKVWSTICCMAYINVCLCHSQSICYSTWFTLHCNCVSYRKWNYTRMPGSERSKSSHILYIITHNKVTFRWSSFFFPVLLSHSWFSLFDPMVVFVSAGMITWQSFLPLSRPCKPWRRLTSRTVLQQMSESCSSVFNTNIHIFSYYNLYVLMCWVFCLSGTLLRVPGCWFSIRLLSNRCRGLMWVP